VAKTRTSARYKELLPAETKEMRQEFIAEIRRFASSKSIEIGEVFTASLQRIDEINERLDQRLDYYAFYHDRNLRQSAQAAIKAFWTLKYRPLRQIEEGSWDGEYDLNVHFAYWIMLSSTVSGVKGEFSKLTHERQKGVLERYHIKAYLRALNEYDISKEALQLLSENLRTILLLEIKLQLCACEQVA